MRAIQLAKPGGLDKLSLVERAIEVNGIEPVIDSSYPLEAIADAFRHQASQRHFGKIYLDIATG